MKTILISTVLLFNSVNSFGQLELLFTQHPLPSEINCLDDGCDLDYGKIPKIIQTKRTSSKDTTLETTKYNREGKYLGSDYGDQNFKFKDFILKINEDTFSVFNKTKGNSKLEYKIVFEKNGDTIKKDLIYYNDSLFTSHMFDSKSKKLIYYHLPSWVEMHISYNGDSTFINYKNYFVKIQELNLRMYESEGIFYIDYFDSLNRIYKNEQFYKYGKKYFPKSLYHIDSLGNINYSFQNPKISNNNCDSILYHNLPINRLEDPLTQLIVIKKNRKGDIIYQKQLANEYEKEVEITNKYYKCGKRKGDLKERKVIYEEIFTLEKIKIKYYLFPKNPIDRWLKKNT